MNNARQARQRLAACLFLSAALHAVLAWLPAERPGHAAPTPPTVLTVRLPSQSSTTTAATLSALSESSNEAPATSPPPPEAQPEPAPAPPPEPNQDAAPQPAERHYYSESELDVWPFAQGHIDVEPAALAGLKEGGKVVVHVWINDSGKVERIGVERNALPPVYSQLAAEAMAKTVFMPAMKNGHPVDSRIRVEIEYRAQP
jgi:protein TonB